MQKKKKASIRGMAFGLCSLALSSMVAPALAGEAVLYAFKGGADGVAPNGPLLNVNGVLYGMTNSGGTNGYGTIFSLTPGGEKTTLYSFQSGSDGANPVGGLINVEGVLYGNTTSGGGGAGAACGASGCGTVFSITPSGAESVIVALPGGNGPESVRNAGLVNVHGTLYGTSPYGGGSENCGQNFGCGTVYSVTPQGKLAVVYAFQGRASGVGDGLLPDATLINVGGTLYGTTVAGGAIGNAGTVFSVTTSGQEKLLYSFHGFYKPKNPFTSLVDLGGTLYGTALQGDGNSPKVSAAFLLRPTGVFKELHQFGGAGDGNFPQSLMTTDQMFYGVAAEGGAAGYGTLFSLTKTGTENQLYSFAGGSDASTPNSKLIEVNGTFYGTSSNGGGSTKCKGGCGTVFSYTP